MDNTFRKLSPKEKAMFRSIDRGDLKKLRELLKAGVDPNTAEDGPRALNHTVLMEAAGLQFTDGVESLLKAGADPNACTRPSLCGGGGVTALGETFTRKPPEEDSDLKITTLLLGAGADPYAVDDGTMTPFTEAVRSGNISAVQLFLDNGVHPGRYPAGSEPPLHGTTYLGKEETRLQIAELLLKNGAPVDGERDDGRTALILAAYTGDEELMEFLMKEGANVNHQAKDGWTPLIAAAAYARDAMFDEEAQAALRMVKKLVEAGADLEARDGRGQNALDAASLARDRSVFRYLRERLKVQGKSTAVRK